MMANAGFRTVYLSARNSLLPLAWPEKDPGDSLGYAFDLSAFLADMGDTIKTVSINAAPNDLVVSGATFTGTVISLVLSGGVSGTDYAIGFAITTAGGAQIDRTIFVLVQKLSQSRANSPFFAGWLPAVPSGALVGGDGKVLSAVAIGDGLVLNGGTAAVAFGTGTGQAAEGNAAEFTANKGIANGYAPLDGTGKLPASLIKSTTLSTLRRLARAARFNNPRANPVMATPPALSWAGAPPAALSNAISWNGFGGGAFNFYGGSNPNSSGWRLAQAATISGGLSNSVYRVHATIDSAKFAIRINEASTSSGLYRVIVNGQYASLAPFASGQAGDGYIIVDFTAAGGRAVRDIIIEGFTEFASIWLGPTEGIYKPGGDVLRAVMIGDSYTASYAVPSFYDGFGAVLGDCLGIRDMWLSGVGGTGYLATSSGTQLTARGRITDLTRTGVDPDMILVAMGHNDFTFTASDITAEALAYFQAIRANSSTALTPMIVFGVFAGNTSANPAVIATETAIQAAVTQANDPNLFFIPVNNDVNGTWMTGTGDTAAPTGSGNSDIYIGPDATHPTVDGYAFLGTRCADAIQRLLEAGNF